ncbi:hypothetical protein QQ008_21170 [Fulvivirgaceae bacterium BMA10]|uniref:Uncharacterized protein n=1 Tax=Splendidivirga corallicola TaxID=3051826 RepID=A0ABT8KT31_9BACT|nr:hypothetical protein [Fulvivirgaceae bacterium BMA10]
MDQAQNTIGQRPKKLWKTFWLSLVIILATLFLLLFWYKVRYSMSEAVAFEVNGHRFNHKLLIATQGSDFKDALVNGIVDHYRKDTVYMRVIDVSDLHNVEENLWDAIVIIHTWENWKPQQDAKAFIDRVSDLSKVVVVSTSGDGDMKIENVDGISSASEIEDVPKITNKIILKLEKILVD